MEPFIDVAPFTAIIDTTLDTIDAFIGDWFYPGLLIGFGVFGLALPATVTFG